MAGVLVLEDDADLRELLGEMFVALGAPACVTAGSLEELQLDPHALGCDLAILDINLGPGRATGIDACRWLVERGFQGEIVFLTGHASSHPLVVEAAEILQARIFAKPLEASRMEELVRGLPR